MNSGWFTALFWVGFLASIAFRRYHWVDTVWLLAMLVFMIAMSAYRIFHFHRNPDEPVTTVRPVPRWLFGPDDQRR
jgi:hypothetical protein